MTDTAVIFRGVAIKAQHAAAWTAEYAEALLREVVPACVRIAVDEDLLGRRFEVTLSVRWWRRVWARRRRAALLVLAGEQVASAPVGVMVRVGWR